jgi:hypothetical protein
MRHPTRYNGGIAVTELQIRKRGISSASGNTGGGSAPQVVTVPSWTSSGGRFYYDLRHGIGRAAIYIQAFNPLIPEYIQFDQLTPSATEPTMVLRVWLTWQPPANTIQLLYF